MTGKKQEFKGILTDEELGIIEDALEFSKSKRIKTVICDNLIKKLYKDFWEI